MEVVKFGKLEGDLRLGTIVEVPNKVTYELLKTH